MTLEEIDMWHRARGFNGIGYHFIVHQNGRIEQGRKITQTGAHCKGYNSTAIGIAYIGGLNRLGNPADTRTAAQKAALRYVVEKLRKFFEIERVMGHREVSGKPCPCFDVRKEFMP